ncbi:hypothetical protein TeGR_g12680, partial [Tetraparma gracilis]
DDAAKLASKKEVSALSAKLCKTAHKFLSKDWCPIDLRETRNKFRYKVTDAGLLVKLFIEHSGRSTDGLTPLEITKVPVPKIGRIGAIKTISSLFAELFESYEKKGPVESLPTLTGQSVGLFFQECTNAIPAELVAIMGSDWAQNPACSGLVLDCVTALVGELGKIMALVKTEPSLVKPFTLRVAIAGGTKFVDSFVLLVLPFMAGKMAEFKEQIFATIRALQTCTRALNIMASHAKRERITEVVRETPRMKKILEAFIYKIKMLMKQFGAVGAITNAHLVSKNIDGTLVNQPESESEEEEEIHDAQPADEDSGSEDSDSEDSRVPIPPVESDDDDDEEE